MRAVLVILLALCASTFTGQPAQAAWSAGASGAVTARSTTIAPPGAAAASCGGLRASVTVTWGPSTSLWANGYLVQWGTTSGAPTSSATVTGLTHTTPSLPLGTYYFRVKATRGAWQSAPTAEVTKTVISILGLGTCI
jgi:hypothetical protein